MSTSNEDGSHDCAPVMWAYGIPCPAMVSPNASQHKEDKLLYPDHYLVWYAEVDSGPHIETVESMGNWVRRGDLGGIIRLIPNVIQENINELNRNTIESMNDMRLKIKMVETNLKEYQDSIKMDSQFYL